MKQDLKTKDLFSKQSEAYALYRPHYPVQLFEYILSFVDHRNRAWDCATGNGQAAAVLADHFTRVDASDISEAQLARAIRKENLHYHQFAAEQTGFADSSFDCITIATAYHWIDGAAFFKEATRVGKPGAVVAAWAYGLIVSGNSALDASIHHFYSETLRGYWDAERSHVDAAYTTVNFPFQPLPEKSFEIVVQWNRAALLGYLSSWSAVQHYTNRNKVSPISIISEELEQHWTGDETITFRFPLFLRLGRISK